MHPKEPFRRFLVAAALFAILIVAACGQPVSLPQEMPTSTIAPTATATPEPTPTATAAPSPTAMSTPTSTPTPPPPTATREPTPTPAPYEQSLTINGRVIQPSYSQELGTTVWLGPNKEILRIYEKHTGQITTYSQAGRLIVKTDLAHTNMLDISQASQEAVATMIREWAARNRMQVTESTKFVFIASKMKYYNSAKFEGEASGYKTKELKYTDGPNEYFALKRDWQNDVIYFIWFRSADRTIRDLGTENYKWLDTFLHLASSPPPGYTGTVTLPSYYDLTSRIAVAVSPIR